MEAGQRHQEILVAGEPRAVVTTPGVKERKQDGAEEAHAERPSAKATTAYFSTATRSNFLSLDRCDFSYATKELCRRMAAPDESSQDALRRAIRYLMDFRMLVFTTFLLQPERDLDVFVDTGYAGCFHTRRSTSGGAAVRGSPLIKHWNSIRRHRQRPSSTLWWRRQLRRWSSWPMPGTLG